MVILSVRLSVRLSVTTRYRLETRCGRDFMFLLYDRVCSILWQNFTSLGNGGPRKQGGEKGAPP